jgi:hypothetical protein
MAPLGGQRHDGADQRSQVCDLDLSLDHRLPLRIVVASLHYGTVARRRIEPRLIAAEARIGAPSAMMTVGDRDARRLR